MRVLRVELQHCLMKHSDIDMHHVVDHDRDDERNAIHVTRRLIFILVATF